MPSVKAKEKKHRAKKEAHDQSTNQSVETKETKNTEQLVEKCLSNKKLEWQCPLPLIPPATDKH